MRSETLCRAALVVCLLVVATPRAANAQQPQQPPPPPPLHEGSAEFAFVGTTGNASTQSLGVGGEFIYRPAPWESRVKVAFVRNETEDEVQAESFLLTARVQRPIAPRLAVYGQYGYTRDRFAGILSRNTIEGGLAYTAISQPNQRLIVDAGFGYANEDRLTGNDISTGTFGTGGLYVLKLSPTSELSEEGRFNFSLSDGSDWRFANIVALTAKLTTLLSLKVSNATRYVNLPAPSFKNTDNITSVALVAKF